MFSMLVHRKALKEIDEFPTEDKQRILSAIRQIAAEPFSGDGTYQGCKGASQEKSGRLQNSLHRQLREGRGCRTQGGQKREVLLGRHRLGPGRISTYKRTCQLCPTD